jgi:hypothetical protein
MRFGLAVSAIGHALILLVGVIALASPRLIDGRTTPSVTVDIVPENEIAAEASASAYGPRLVETATRALRQCQPFTFLPAEKYQEWKLLDLSFSPRGLAGG